MYYLLLPDLDKRTAFIDALKQKGIGAVFHYVPLDSSPMGENVWPQIRRVDADAIAERPIG